MFPIIAVLLLFFLPVSSPRWFRTWQSSSGACPSSPSSSLTSTSWPPNCERGSRAGKGAVRAGGGRPAVFSHPAPPPRPPSPQPGKNFHLTWACISVCVCVCVLICVCCARAAGPHPPPDPQKATTRDARRQNASVWITKLAAVEVTPDSHRAPGNTRMHHSRLS